MNVNVITPTGELVNIPSEQLNDALQQGYKAATDQDVQKDIQKEQYGQGFGNELQSAIEGAASVASFGLSRDPQNLLKLSPGLYIANKIAQGFGVNPAQAVTEKLGITPQEQALRKEYNPVASGVGEAVGIGASLLAPEESLVGLVGKGGEAATQAVTNYLGQSAASKIAGKIVGQGLEGLAYGASQPISEASLGDPTLTASKVMSQIGIGGLIGGIIGGLSSALGLGVKSFLPQLASPEAEQIIGKGTSTLEGEGTTTAQGPLKMEGTIDFGLPDKEILKRAESLNPKAPLNQNDLSFIKQETPEVFNKLGTAELPINDPMTTDKVYVGDTVRQGMKNLTDKSNELNQAADDALSNTTMPNGVPLSMTKNQYAKMFKDTISEIKGSKEYGLPIGKRAVQKLDTWLKAAKDLPDEIPATDIRDILQNIRDEGKLYSRDEGLKNDFISKSLNKIQSNLDDYLKDNSPAYKEIQKEFAPFTRKKIELEDHLNWNNQTNDSNLTGDWVTNRVMKPFQSSLPGTKGDAELIKWFSPYAGADLEKTAKANFIYGKLNPDLASAGQKGSWGARVAEGFNLLKNPTEVPGKVLSGTAKIALTGELPEFITQMRARGVQDLLLGKSSNPSAVNSILGKFGDLTKKGSQFLEGPLSNAAVPAGVKLHQFIDSSDSIDHADQKLETLMAIEKAQKKADQQMNQAVKGIFSDNVPRETIDHFADKSHKELAEGYDKLKGQINQMINQPEMLMNQLANSTKGMTAAPNVVSALNMTAVRAMQFLAQKLNAESPQNPLPLDPQFVPSRPQINSLIKTLQFINQPWDAVKEISNGQVSQEAKDVLNNVHPELYNDLKAQVMNVISEMKGKDKNIPMSKRLALSYFLDQPLDSTMTQQAIASNQMVFMNPQATQAQPNPHASASKNLTLSSRVQTPMQKVASR